MREQVFYQSQASQVDRTCVFYHQLIQHVVVAVGQQLWQPGDSFCDGNVWDDYRSGIVRKGSVRRVFATVFVSRVRAVVGSVIGSDGKAAVGQRVAVFIKGFTAGGRRIQQRARCSRCIGIDRDREYDFKGIVDVGCTTADQA